MRVEPRRWAGYDLDGAPAGAIDPLRQPELAVSFARRCLPPQHHDATVAWQISASAGFKPGKLRLRLWFWLDRPWLGRQVARWCARGVEAKWHDPSTLKNEVLPHFLAVAVVGGPDPCPQRWGVTCGARDQVPTAAVPKDKAPVPGDAPDIIAGNMIALENKYGGLLDQHRRMAVRKMRDEIERVRAAASDRHPLYLEASARVEGLCRYWGLPSSGRAKLEEAYVSTFTPDEARKRECGSTKGVPNWLDLAGYPVAVSTAIPAPVTSPTAPTTVFFGSWSQLLLGRWTGNDLLANPYENAAYVRGRVWLRAMADYDAAVPRRELQRRRRPGLLMIEHRAVAELRAIGRQLIGVAVPFDRPAHVHGFDEVVRRGAFADSLAEGRDVLLLLDHDMKRVLARSRSKALRLAETGRGLEFEADLPGTSWATDALEMVRSETAGGL